MCLNASVRVCVRACMRNTLQRMISIFVALLWKMTPYRALCSTAGLK